MPRLKVSRVTRLGEISPFGIVYFKHFGLKSIFVVPFSALLISQKKLRTKFDKNGLSLILADFLPISSGHRGYRGAGAGQ
jgi:hypothetical protein